MAHEELVLRPIGVIRTPFTRGAGAPAQGALDDVEGTVELDPAFEEGLADLDGFERIHLVYAFHASPEDFRLRVTPYLDVVERGLFATRAPRRPNPIGMTVVRLLAIEGPRLRVAGVDMIDGTPLLDIKPYPPPADAFPESRGGWFEARRNELGGETPRADDRFERD